jgi:hypothetical protein
MIKSVTLLLVAALMAATAVATAQTGSASEREADLSLDCFDGNSDACLELEALQLEEQGGAATVNDSRWILFETYKVSQTRPRELDAFARDNRSLFGDRFYRCLRAVRSQAPTLSQVHDEQCLVHLNPQARADCRQKNAWRDMGPYLSDLERAIASNGSVSWLQTASGQQQASLTGLFDSQIEDYRREVYPGLLFTLGQDTADQMLRDYATQIYGNLELTIEPMRDPLYCS